MRGLEDGLVLGPALGLDAGLALGELLGLAPGVGGHRASVLPQAFWQLTQSAPETCFGGCGARAEPGASTAASALSLCQRHLDTVFFGRFITQHNSCFTGRWMRWIWTDAARALVGCACKRSAGVHA